MDKVNQLFDFVYKCFVWWFMVMPWEQAIFVRAGKNHKLLDAGIYLKIPFIDVVYIQTVRMRMIDIPVQTMSTKDGKTVTMKSAIRYTIADVQLLYLKMAHPEMTLSSIAMSLIADYVSSHLIEEVSHANIEKYVNENIKAEEFGLKDVVVKLTNFATVKTFRLIQDGSYMAETLNMEPKLFNR